MKRLITLVFAILVGSAISQTKNKIYKCRVYTTDFKSVAGYLVDVNDSVIVVSPHSLLDSTTVIPYTNIKLINIRRKNSIGKGIGIGVVVGGGLGAIIGLASYEESHCQHCIDFGPGGRALVGATLGGLAGGFTGFIAACFPKKIHVNGSDQVKGQLAKYALQPKQEQTP